MHHPFVWFSLASQTGRPVLHALVRSNLRSRVTVFSGQLNTDAHAKPRRSSITCFCFFKRVNMEWEEHGAKGIWCRKTTRKYSNIQNTCDNLSRSPCISRLRSHQTSYCFTLREGHFVNSANNKHNKEQAKFRWIRSRQTDKKWLRRKPKIHDKSSPTHSKIQI